MCSKTSGLNQIITFKPGKMGLSVHQKGELLSFPGWAKHGKICKINLDFLRVRRYFEKTGCLMTVDGSFDGNIKPQGTVNYSFAVSDSSSSSSSSSVSQTEMESKYDDGDMPLNTADLDSSDESDVVHHSGKDEPDSEEDLLQTPQDGDDNHFLLF